MRALSIFLSVLATATPAFAADCFAERDAPRPHLVELYTSEGCSSCPPADDWLRRAPRAANVAALAFHVDYWDSLGWRDRFADPRFTQRQRDQAARDGGSGVFTPQVVVDGHNWSGWYHGGWLAAAQAPAASATMRVTVSTGSALHVRIETTIDPADAAAFRNYVAVTEDGLASDVRAGENRGSVLRHDHVVRVFSGPLPLSGEIDVALPKDLERSRAAVVAFAQRTRDGAVAQALVCGL